MANLSMAQMDKATQALAAIYGNDRDGSRFWLRADYLMLADEYRPTPTAIATLSNDVREMCAQQGIDPEAP